MPAANLPESGSCDVAKRAEIAMRVVAAQAAQEKDEARRAGTNHARVPRCAVLVSLPCSVPYRGAVGLLGHAHLRVLAPLQMSCACVRGSLVTVLTAALAVTLTATLLH